MAVDSIDAVVMTAMQQLRALLQYHTALAQQTHYRSVCFSTSRSLLIILTSKWVLKSVVNQVLRHMGCVCVSFADMFTPNLDMTAFGR